jgi:hypothetical protein
MELQWQLPLTAQLCPYALGRPVIRQAISRPNFAARVDDGPSGVSDWLWLVTHRRTRHCPATYYLQASPKQPKVPSPPLQARSNARAAYYLLAIHC